MQWTQLHQPTTHSFFADVKMRVELRPPQTLAEDRLRPPQTTKSAR